MSTTASARRRPTNLSISEEVMQAVKAHGLNASQIAERALRDAVRERERAQWRIDNAEAIKEYNDRVEREGTFNDDLRQFSRI